MQASGSKRHNVLPETKVQTETEKNLLGARPLRSTERMFLCKTSHRKYYTIFAFLVKKTRKRIKAQSAPVSLGILAPDPRAMLCISII